MAPRLRPKPNTHARIQRGATQFSELEITPSRPEDQRPHLEAYQEDSSRQSQAKVSGDFQGEPGIENITQGNDLQTIKPFSWSDAGSTTNNTRRSSPADLGELSADDFWDLDESIAPFSSPSSEKNKLPDTMPLVSTSQADESLAQAPKVDFSETASTIRRSSPFATSDGPRDIWNFDDSPPDSSPAPSISKDVPVSSSDHLPADELYDSTPRKVAVPRQAAAELNGNQAVGSGDTKGDSTRTTLKSKGKRERPRAKKPIRFDPLTQEIVDVPTTKKKSTTTRLPIVSALQEAAKASSSPLAVPQKQKKTRRARPQKKAKSEMRQAPDNPPPSRSTDFVTLIGSAAQPVVESSSECLHDLPSDGHRDDMTANVSLRDGDVIDPVQALKRQYYPPPPPVDDLDDDPYHKAETLPAKRGRSNKRRLSRQFSVSERGSPVVVVDAAPTKKTGHVLPEPEPIQPCNLEQPPAIKSSSFLRSASNDQYIEQQHDGAFKDIEGRSSSQWLRRVSDKEPAPKRKSSMGKKLRDEIMKSFLGHAETAQEPQGGKPACATIPNHAENQIRRTIDQLIVRLEDKKTATFKVADVYRKSGQDSLSHLKQQCLQDSGSLTETFRNDSGLFGKRLQAAATKIEDWSSDRAKTAMDLDNTMESRRQGYNRARLSLRAMRDELTRHKGVML